MTFLWHSVKTQHLQQCEHCDVWTIVTPFNRDSWNCVLNGSSENSRLVLRYNFFFNLTVPQVRPLDARFSWRRPVFSPGRLQDGFRMDEVALKQVSFSEFLGFPQLIMIPTLLHPHLSPPHAVSQPSQSSTLSHPLHCVKGFISEPALGWSRREEASFWIENNTYTTFNILVRWTTVILRAKLIPRTQCYGIRPTVTPFHNGHTDLWEQLIFL